MGQLSNPRHERFAQELASGKSQFEAHGIAGFKAHRGNASLLAQDKSIVERVAEIQAEHVEVAAKATEKAAEALSIDRQWVMARLIENASRAAASEDFAPSNRALELLGKEMGMFIDRKQLDIDGELRGLTDAQLIAILASEGEEGDCEEGGSSLTH
jgi:phage terminase small subunit